MPSKKNIIRTKIDPIKPIAPYIGGKRLLSKTIIERINATDHQTYAEAFVGMGGVFFRRNEQPQAEVINDYSQEVSNLFRILQRHYPQFLDVVKYQITSRSSFNRLVDTPNHTLTDLERAAKFIYLQRTAFGGKVSGKNFGVSATRPARFDLTKLEPMLADVNERLSSVVIECLSFEKFIPKYDKPGTLFYLDPPYFGCENDYGKNMFERSDFELLANILGDIKGKFLLSLNDVPEIREIFKNFDIQSVQTTYSLGKNSSKKVGEVIISN